MATPWHKVVTPRPEVREGRSFRPDEFAIALEQVVAGTAPADYTDPAQFFARTSFTSALTENVGQVLRRLSGQTANTSPVMALVTQFGGGKTHTLATLYHLARSGEAARGFPGIERLQADALLPAIPHARVGVFVGGAWDPQPGRETPWIDLARQLAGDAGVALLGSAAMTAPPGTDALLRIFHAAGAPVLLLMDEVLNFMGRHREFAEPFLAYLQNLTVAMTGTQNAAMVVSLPRSQVEMTEWDIKWQERITKVVNRVSSNLLANNEAEIADVVRRRLFEELGSEITRRNVAHEYADWSFQNRAQLPPQWTAADSASTETQARDYLTRRFADSYPFHPATLSVFQRKWASVQQFQATRGTLAMLAQWVSLAFRAGFTYNRQETLITLGSAPLDSADFRGIVLRQLGDDRLNVALQADLAGELAIARALDADTRDALRDIHRRVGTAIFFESSGGQMSQVARLPELRFALGGPTVDTATVDNAAYALENRAFYIRKVGTDGYQISSRPTLKKVVSERRASLDYAVDVLPAMRKVARDAFERGRTLPLVMFPADANEVDDTPRLTLVVLDPTVEWNGETRARLADWTRQRGQSPRLYPGALVWCVRQEGAKLRNEVQDWLAWQRVLREMEDGTLGSELTPGDKREVQEAVRTEAGEAQAEVGGSYRWLAYYDPQADDKLGFIDLGSGHAAGGETLAGRVIAALKSKSLLSEGVGAGYLERNWPPVFLASGAWPLSSLRQAFVTGALTRLLDPDRVLREKILAWVESGDFGLASGARPDGTYDYVWFQEHIAPDEISFDSQVFLLKKDKARALLEAERAGSAGTVVETVETSTQDGASIQGDSGTVERQSEEMFAAEAETTGAEPVIRTLRISGPLPPEAWNRVGIKLLPKLRSAGDLHIEASFSVSLPASQVDSLKSELSYVLDELGLRGQLRVEEE